MKIALDISPLQTGHSVRGVGFYLQRLKDALIENYPEHTYLFFNSLREVTSDFDVVHIPYFDPFQLSLPTGIKNKLVVTVHDVTPLLFPTHFPAGLKGIFKWQIQKYRLRKVDSVITDSFASKQDIMRIAGLPESRVQVVSLAAGKEFKILKKSEKIIKEVQKKFHLPEKFVLYVGDATWNKNVPMLMEITKKLDIPLVMVGKAIVESSFDKKNIWNEDILKIQHLAKNDKNVYRLGFVSTEDLVALYNCATVFVWPSLYEGFGLPILEAMQCGCPVITTRESAMPEVAGDSAFYFDAYSSENLTFALQNVYNAPILQSELSRSGLEHAKKFSWKKTAQETIIAYEKILE